MNDNKKQKNLWINFLLAWILANGLGWLLISANYIVPLWGLWAPLGISFFIGLFQWIVLQKYIGVDSTWFWVSIPTYGFFLFAFFYFNIDISSFTFLIINVICLGLVGLLQRSALDYYVHNATTWVVASPFASIIGMYISRALNNQLGFQSSAPFWALSGILYGSITGIAIISLQNSVSPQPEG